MKTKILTEFSNTEKEIDFSKKGLIVISESGTEVLITTGSETTYCFSGYCLASTCLNYVGNGNNHWVKTNFKILDQPITITFEN